MTKKFVPVQCRKRIHRVFQQDIKKIYYMGSVSRPSIPRFFENDYFDVVLKRSDSSCT